jgi:hypothetical protein
MDFASTADLPADFESERQIQTSRESLLDGGPFPPKIANRS